MSAVNNISLYIPRVFINLDKEYVAKAFNKIGVIEEIDFVAKQNQKGSNYNAVYIHFKRWYNTTTAINFYKSVVDSTKETRLYYEEPWYWLVLPNNGMKRNTGERKPIIDLGELNSISTAKPSTTTLKEDTVVVLPDVTEKQAIEDIKESLEVSFDEVAAFEAEIDTIEELLEEEEQYLISIDGRYVQHLESENMAMHTEIMELRAALINLDQMYQAEAAKVRAFNATSVDL